MISSLKIVSAQPDFSVYFYEHDNYGGKCLAIKKSFSTYEDRDLSDNKMKGQFWFFSWESWSNKISSLKIVFEGNWIDPINDDGLGGLGRSYYKGGIPVNTINASSPSLKK